MPLGSIFVKVRSDEEIPEKFDNPDARSGFWARPRSAGLEMGIQTKHNNFRRLT